MDMIIILMVISIVLALFARRPSIDPQPPFIIVQIPVQEQQRRPGCLLMTSLVLLSLFVLALLRV